MAKRNIYKHTIELKKITIKNAPRADFAKKLEELPYRGYEVEDLSDGRKIVITKPGGKRSMFGQPKKEDFLVYLYNPDDNTLWQITHAQIREQIVEVGNNSPKLGIELVHALEKVFNGEEPDDVLAEKGIETSTELSTEAILKLYKWIWGQEDVNYPTRLGREMVWFGKDVKDGVVSFTGKGLFDLLEEFRKRL